VRPGSLAPRSFPPADLVELADLDADQMVYVAPLKLGTSDWGMLALVGPIEADVATGREMMNQWAALLTIALDHEAVLKSLRKQEELLRHAALYDPLTGLANRTLFLSELERALASQEQFPERNWSVLLLDLDGFKLVNDSMGHLAGDRLLILVAERVRRRRVRHTHQRPSRRARAGGGGAADPRGARRPVPPRRRGGRRVGEHRHRAQHERVPARRGRHP
jgi:hypothetical protein